MTEAELDDVAFLTGAECSNGRQPRDRVAVCSQKRAFFVTALVLGALLGIALLIAYGNSACPCAGKIPRGFIEDGYNTSEPFEPIASNGQPFPYLLNFLPPNIKPNHYTLTIHPNLTTMECKGQVSIEFYVEKEMNFVVLHAENLNITEKALIGPKGFALKINRMLEYPPRQQIYIEFRDKLRKKSNYSLNLRWYSKLKPEPEGFYVDEYDLDGSRKLLAATILGPGRARKAFPCFDEPHLRATFKLSLFRDRFHIGLSNFPIFTTDDVGFYMGTGLLRDDFFETPPICPDSLSFIVSLFKREILEPSSTYQTVTTTTVAPINRFTTLKSPENLLKIDKIPFQRNMSAILKKGLYIKMSNQNEVTTMKSENLLKESENQHIDDTECCKTAPSYTFYATESVLPKTKFILETSRSILESLQSWLDVAYKLPKLDFVALPSTKIKDNIQSNLGLISCKASFLKRFTENSITTLETHSAALLISEAIVKQYFGETISPKTWKAQYLFDGILHHLSRLIFAPLYPQWSVNEMALLDIFSAMDVDVLQGWESILNGSSETGQNNEFYIHKSSAILMILNSAMGEDNFRKCLGSFLKVHQYQTALPDDLISTCSRKANSTKNISQMMNTWISNSGHPIVYLNKTNSSISIMQKPFKFEEFSAIHEDLSFDNESTDTTTLSPEIPVTISAKEAKKRNTKWSFPINYSTNVNYVQDTIWLDNTDSFKFTLKDKIKWIKINSDQTGYYRVLYNKENWDGLIEQLHVDHKKFSTKDRMGLISDSFSLCHANLLSCDVTLELLAYLHKDLQWAPVYTGLKNLEKWRKILKYSESYMLLAEFGKSILVKLVNEIGWADEGTDEIRMLRSTVLMSSVLWEEPGAINKAKTILHNHLTNATEIPPNLRGFAYIGSVLTGEIVFWRYLMDRYISLRKENEGFEERLELLRALGVTKDAWLQNRLLSFVTTLPFNEIIEVLEAISSTSTGGAMACRFLQAKWFDLQKRFGKGSINFAKIISAITKYGANKFDYDELKSLVDRFGGSGPGNDLLSMTLRTVAANVEWIYKSQSTIYSWLESYNF